MSVSFVSTVVFQFLENDIDVSFNTKLSSDIYFKVHVSFAWYLRLLFSAHISYGKGEYLNQTVFFYKICQELIVYVIWRGTFTEFTWHKFSSMRYVFVKIFGLFWVTPNDPKDLKGIRSKISGREKDLKSLNFRSFSLDPIPQSKIAMAQLVKAKKAENIPVLSGRLVLEVHIPSHSAFSWPFPFLSICGWNIRNCRYTCHHSRSKNFASFSDLYSWTIAASLPFRYLNRSY